MPNVPSSYEDDDKNVPTDSYWTLNISFNPGATPADSDFIFETLHEMGALTHTFDPPGPFQSFGCEPPNPNVPLIDFMRQIQDLFKDFLDRNVINIVWGRQAETLVLEE